MDKEFLYDPLLEDELLPDNLFTSAVAQIRARENSLLSDQDLNSLLICETPQECIQFLLEKGWGPVGNNTPEELLKEENDKCWKLLHQLCSDKEMEFFDIFRYRIDYHNLKVAIKESYILKEVPNVYMADGTIPIEKIRKCAADNDFAPLPYPMMRCAIEARDVLFHTGDSQLCDVIIDKGSLAAIYQSGQNSGNDLIKDYVELKCGSANINIAVRASKAGKDTDFLQRAFVECHSISIPKLISATLNGIDSICEYLSETSYRDAVDAIKKSSEAFDKWCDDRMMQLIQPQKYNAFTISPLAAYKLAKDNEIKTVRIILSGKFNDLPEQKIRERMRKSYV